jgi:molybdate transport system ATP-binding protein
MPPAWKDKPVNANATLTVDVSRRLGNFSLNAAFRAEAGITALFGRSGSGKTSLINMLAGLDRPDTGRIVAGEEVLFDADAGIDLPPQRRRIGYVFQEDRLFPHLSVRANLSYGMGRGRNEAAQPGFDHMVETLDLGALLERRPRTLSGGEKQRVAIGRALLSAPRLILMDEPLASLGATHKDEILPFIERLRDQFNLPIVYVSHALGEVIRLADTMIILSDGRVAAAGAVEDLMTRLDLRPLTGRYEAGAVLSVIVAGQDRTFALTELAFAGQRLVVPALDAPLGTKLRVRIRARDVSLSLHRPTETSVLNIFQCRVREIESGAGPQVDIALDVGTQTGSSLLARITRRSLHQLELIPGKSVFALVKAIAVDRHSLGGAGIKAIPR